MEIVKYAETRLTSKFQKQIQTLICTDSCNELGNRAWKWSQ